MKKVSGFTLVEMLVGMAILGILMLAFTQLFGGSLRASSEINARNELINEGQIAQQLITSRLQNAYYIYPPGATLQLTTGGNTTRNTVRSGAGQNWTIGTDPFVAMLLPPAAPGNCVSSGSPGCFKFFAYYPMLRSSLITDVPASAPTADPNNASAWILMEYRANIVDNVNRSSDRLASPPTASTLYRNASGNMLVDFVQPSSAAPTYTMFTVKVPGAICRDVDPDNTAANTAAMAANPDLCSSWVDVDVRMLENRGGKTLRIPGGDAPFATPTPTLSTRVYPRNWY